MSAYAEAVTQQLAVLIQHALDHPSTPEPARPMSDEEIAWEMGREQAAENRMSDRQHMSDRDADYEADRYENRTERWSA